MFELFLLLSLIGTGLYFNKDDINKLQSANKENVMKIHHNNIYQSNGLKNAVRSHQGAVNRRALAARTAGTNIHPQNYKKSGTQFERHTNKSKIEHFTDQGQNNPSQNNPDNGFGGSSQYNTSDGVYSQLLGRNMRKEEFKKNDMGINNMVPFFL